MLPGGWGQSLSVVSIPVGHWQRLGLEGGRLVWQLVPWDRAGTNPVFSSSAKMLQGRREQGGIGLNSLLTLKTLGAPHQEAAGEPSVLAASFPAPSLPPTPLQQRWAAPPCHLHRESPQALLAFPAVGGLPCDLRLLLLKSLKPNLFGVLSLHGFRPGQGHAKGVDPRGKPSPLFAKPRRRSSNQQHLSKLSPSINPLCLGTRGH